MKAQAAWKEMYIFQLKDGQERSTLVMATGLAPINPTSPASHTYWTVALSPNPSESQRSWLTASPPGPAVSSLSNRCYRLPLSVVVMHQPRHFILGVLLYSAEKNMNVLKDLDRGDVKWLLRSLCWILELS